jgi:hypothetical protein
VSASRRRSAPAERWAVLAIVLAAAALAALGLAWWRDGARHFERPSWEVEQFVELSPAAPAATRERWLVAVNLSCPHCKAHLRTLAGRIARRAQPPALGVLIVDQRARPSRLDLGVPLAAGAWWDSAQVWRERWGRRVYGETFRFDARGRLLSATPAGTLPDSSGSRM